MLALTMVYAGWSEDEACVEVFLRSLRQSVMRRSAR
jgi:hypothetical protein